MTAEPVFFRDLGYVLVAAVVGALLARAARQPLILGYVAAGILLGPFTPGPVVADLHTFELFAEIGVILLMFSVGIEFSLRDLLRVKWVALVGGPLGILVSGALGLAAGATMGWPPRQGLIVGLIVSVASTTVLARLLIDRGELRSEHGRVSVGITLVEDLAVVILTVLLPSVGHLQPGGWRDVAFALGQALLVLGPVIYLATRVVPTLMARVARTGNQELFVMVGLAIGLGTAALAQAVGLSLALGAFLAGLLINASDHAHEMLERLHPLRDAFVALFFVTVGTLVDPRSVLDHLPLLGAMLVLIVPGKLLVRAGVVRLFRYPLATAVLTGVGLTQIGEFSYILVKVAREAGLVGDEVYQATLAASLLTILVNATLVRAAPTWIQAVSRSRPPERPAPAPSPGGARGHVILGGFGRVGSAVGEALDAFGIPYVVIERDRAVGRALEARGVKALVGDTARRDLLEQAGVDRAGLVIVALPELEPARKTVRAVRAAAGGVPILTRAHGPAEAALLAEAGATAVVQPELEASAMLIRQALAALGMPAELGLTYLERFRAALGHAPAPPGPATSPSFPEVREVRIRGPLADQSLRDARVRERFGVTILAVRREGGLVLNPPPETILRSGDHVRAFGRPEQIAALEREAGS